jgi:hypothetical protein
MVQFHSMIISEPIAQICGLISGLVTYGAMGLLTTDHDVRLWSGMVVSVLFNLAIGAKINLFLLDLLALIVVRPLSAAAGARLLAVVANALSN